MVNKTLILIALTMIFVSCNLGFNSPSPSPPEIQKKQERENLENLPEALKGTWYYTYTTNDASVSSIQYINRIWESFGKVGTYGAESLGGSRDNCFSISSYTITYYSASGITDNGKITSKYGYMFITHTENDKYFFEGPVSVWADEWLIIANGSFILNQNETLSLLLESERGYMALPNLPAQNFTYTKNRPW